MTTKDTDNSEISGANLEKLNENLRKVEKLSERLSRVMSNRTTHQSSLDGPDQALFSQATTAYWAEAMQNPAKVIEHQLDFWSKSVTHFVEAQQALSHGKLQAPADPGPKDRRFANPMWDTNPYFNFIKQQYQTEFCCAAAGRRRCVGHGAAGKAAPDLFQQPDHRHDEPDKLFWRPTRML